jgi:hypothetical protein
MYVEGSALPNPGVGAGRSASFAGGVNRIAVQGRRGKAPAAFCAGLVLRNEKIHAASRQDSGYKLRDITHRDTVLTTRRVPRRRTLQSGVRG